MTQIASAHIRKRDQHGLAAAALDSLLIYQAEPIKCSMSRFNLPLQAHPPIRYWVTITAAESFAASKACKSFACRLL
jgi:hypothetical protein